MHHKIRNSNVDINNQFKKQESNYQRYMEILQLSTYNKLMIIMFKFYQIKINSEKYLVFQPIN